MESNGGLWVYFTIIRKRLWLIILLLLVTEGVILSYSLTAEPVYRATVRLQVLASDRTEVSLFTQYRSSTTVSEIQQAQSDFIRSLKSGLVAWKTIADLNLEIGAVDLLSGLSTAIEGDSIIVTIESDDPGRAEAIAVQQVDNALEYYRNRRATPSRVLGEFVSEQLALEQERMLKAEKAFLEFKSQHDLDSISQETRALQDLIRNLKIEHARVVIERERADVFAKIYRAEQDKANATADEIDAKNAELAEAEDTEEGEGTEKAEDAEKTEETEFAPATKKFYRDLARQHEAVAIGYEAQRDGHAAGLVIYDQMIAERTTELEGLLGLYSEYDALERELARARNNCDFLWGKENEARLLQLQAERLGYIQITEQARKPEAPVPSNTLQLALVGGVVSILTGVVLSFFFSFLGSLKPPESPKKTVV